MSSVFLSKRRHVGHVLAAALLGLTAAACDGADSPLAPPSGVVVSTASTMAAPVPSAAAALAPLLDDAVERLVPSLGASRGVTDVRPAFTALRAALPAAGAPSGADLLRLAAAVAPARAALRRLGDDATLAPERDALTLALDVIETIVGSGR